MEQNEQNTRPESDQESVLNCVYERLQLYLSNLSCAEAPPIYKKQNSARKSRSNEKKPSSSEQVKPSFYGRNQHTVSLSLFQTVVKLIFVKLKTVNNKVVPYTPTH